MFVRCLLPFTILILLFACQSKGKTPSAPTPVDVTEIVVIPKSIPVIFDYVGFAESSHPVEIRAKVEGYLDKIAYKEGGLVHEGDLLFQLDPEEYAAKVEQAKGDVAKQVAILANAELAVQRLTPLYEQKAASKKDLDSAISAKLSAEASLQTAKAVLLNAEINVNHTSITSPITGFADKSRYRQGALITPGEGGLLTTVSVFDPMWVYFTISDNDILRISQEEAKKSIVIPHSTDLIELPKDKKWEAEAILSDGSIFPYTGVVNFRSPTYDQTTGTLQDRAVFPNPKGDLRPGQFVRIKVYGAQRPNAILIPRRALLQKKQGMFVYLINKENKVIAQDVETGEWVGDDQLITKGLIAGDHVIVDGINKVYPGSLVNVISSSDQPQKDPTTSLPL